jgi:glycosyltransferase involved in cell wall biosynthesis
VTPLGRGLQIAITVDPELPVPPDEYGGIERVVSLLVNELSQRGHEVTLFAHRNSTAGCAIVRYPGLSSNSPWDTIRNTGLITSTALRRRFDLIHSFGRLGYLTPIMPLRIPKIMSYQRQISRRSVVCAAALSRGSLQFTACSDHMMRGLESLARWHVVYNGVSSTLYSPEYSVPDDAPLMFLGRIEHIKGAHIAIDVARRTGRRLIIAGNLPPGEQYQSYFDRKIRPHVDGQIVTYVGPVNDTQKAALLSRSAALLMPILWEEPFGIVMAEALACGTPVIGLRRGSVPEVVQDGVNGFSCHCEHEMVAAVHAIHRISRGDCRRTMEQRFSGSVMAEGYLRVYRAVLGDSASIPPRENVC